jgi:hypothetical protein
VHLELFDVAGRRIIDRRVEAGSHGTAAWNGRDATGETVGSGRYLSRITRGAHTFTAPVVVLR